MRKNKYMHTIFGKPAGFCGEQICYGWQRMKLANSLKQIRKEQKATKKYRTKMGFDYKEEEYDYLLVVVDVEEPE